MFLAADPIGAGLVPSLARPGGRFTGLTTMDLELDAKRIDLLHEAVPELAPPISRSDIRPFPAGGLGSSYPRTGTGELRAADAARKSDVMQTTKEARNRREVTIRDPPA